MTMLVISDGECVDVRSSWADILASEHINGCNLVNQALTKIANRDARVSEAREYLEPIHHEGSLFSEMLSLAMMYLDKPDVLEECMQAFIFEHPSLIDFGSMYLESLGSALIDTLGQILGPARFTGDLKPLWIKIYIYLADLILQNATSSVSDMESVCDSMALSVSSLYEDVEPLTPKEFSSPMPKFMSETTGGDKNMSIDILGNEKYKGFRRSSSEDTTSKADDIPPCSPPIKVELDDEPALTPRSPKRYLAQQSVGLGLSTPQIVSLHKSQTFDPRRRKCHRRSLSETSMTPISSCESPVSDVEDHMGLKEDDMDFGAPFGVRCAVFDHTSFGITGLTPIAESADDDDVSHYSSVNESSFAGSADGNYYDEDTSSRATSLSLHTHDYKSSVSSGSEISRKKVQSSRANFDNRLNAKEFSTPPQMYTYPKYSSSVPSFKSGRSGQRASVGFMRSSFVLKKEIDNSSLGCFDDSTSLHHTRSSLNNVVCPVSRSACSLPFTRRDPDFVLGAEKTSQDSTSVNGSCSKPCSNSSKKILSSQTFGRTSLSKMLRALFRSSSTKQASSPVSTTPMSEKNPECNIDSNIRQNRRSVISSINACTRVSSIDIRANAVSVVNASSLHSRPVPKSDNVSISSMRSGKSTLSFFKGKTSDRSRDDTNKYLVKRVPHKTIYLKDFVM
ncbi:hypothetical protein OY671_000466 [Metschnikowia pulcherrima]|nr:hypothetical protein OY671_000466 [Metschnikowia pulcherrima]